MHCWPGSADQVDAASGKPERRATRRSASCPSDDSHCNVSFQVQLPRALPLRASTQLGAVQVTGMTGSVQVYDALGSVQLANLAGPVSVTDQLGDIDSRDPQFQEAQDVFARSGAALGRALAHVSNTVNPSSVIAYLPGPLAEPKPDTAAASYRSAVHQEVTSAFAAGNNGDYLKIRALPTKPEDLALRGARAAGVCVLESFIEHALRLDGCTTTLRRSSTASGNFEVQS